MPRLLHVRTLLTAGLAVQEVHELSDDSQLRVTVAQWLTPSGHAIQGEGLLPDVEMPAAEGRDAPLDAAVQYLLHGSANG